MTRHERHAQVAPLMRAACKGRDPADIERAIGSFVDFGENSLLPTYDASCAESACLRLFREAGGPDLLRAAMEESK